MANNGLWAELSCMEIPSRNKDVDVRFKGATRPDDPGGGTTTEIEGILHPNGAVEGQVVFTDNGVIQAKANTDGKGFVAKAPDGKPVMQGSLDKIAQDALAKPAEACKRALLTVPGISG